MAQKEHESEYHHNGKCFYRTGLELPRLDKKDPDHRIVFRNHYLTQVVRLTCTVKRAYWEIPNKPEEDVKPQEAIFYHLKGGNDVPVKDGEYFEVEVSDSSTYKPGEAKLKINTKIIGTKPTKDAVLHVEGKFEPTDGCEHKHRDDFVALAHTEWHIEC